MLLQSSRMVPIPFFLFFYYVSLRDIVCANIFRVKVDTTTIPELSSLVFSLSLRCTRAYLVHGFSFIYFSLVARLVSFFALLLSRK